MEAQEEVPLGSQEGNIIKGKRTKRFRPQSPIPFAAIAPSGSMFNGGDDVQMENNKDNYGEYLSLSSFGDENQESTTEEEEDMANCLILLAQGQSREPPKLLQHQYHRVHHQQQQDSAVVYNKFNSRRFMEAASNGTGKAGHYVYECKTCNRTFPSFQALGGHRASHKKPKVAAVVDDKIRQFTTTTNIGLPDEEEGQLFMKTNNISSLSLQLSNTNNNYNNNNRGLYGSNSNNKANKVHECSICGSEFTSGQALGGHMRRHRGSIGANITPANTALSLKVPTPMEQPQQPKKPKNVLSLDLDLNLPAPDEDNREPKFPFASKQQQQQQQSSLVFSAPTLVDCHY
ncbi:Cupredoxin superfamily protein [Hibiscus syriacus]|uniref:Cupredoxin superfamily protein n=1 Tax=Hibiscus syriacus TaxID=106335 RepID=A0A6A3BAR7_HIBSY|nr:zinc finger protein ZAT5-like [Hibiscus syriacus]KAE8711989.1 Cupredoxin superfamily protein [Hibiscus syriacus]